MTKKILIPLIFLLIQKQSISTNETEVKDPLDQDELVTNSDMQE